MYIFHRQDQNLVQSMVGLDTCVELELEVLEQRVDVALHDPHVCLPEGETRIGPAALPEQPQPIFAPVLQAPGLRRLGDILPDLRQIYLFRPAGNDASGSVALQWQHQRRPSRSGTGGRVAAAGILGFAVLYTERAGKWKSSRLN